jgi:hypothetical protein
MPITPIKHRRHGVEDDYTVHHHKAYIRPKTVEAPISNPLPTWDCIGPCKQTFIKLVGSIRGRILKGYRIKMGKKMVLSDYPNPETVRQSPEYRNGRLCNECAKAFTVTNKAPLLGEVQYLKDNIDIRPHLSVTQQTVINEDDDNNRLIAQLEQDKNGYIQSGNIKIPLGTGQHVQSPPDDEPLHVNAFRRFMLNRQGGLKDYHKHGVNRFDREINHSNIKATDKRWFNRG